VPRGGAPDVPDQGAGVLVVAEQRPWTPGRLLPAAGAVRLSRWRCRGDLPVLGEGFGLPVLEAMAAGAAVLTTRLLSLREVGGDAVAYCGIDAK
jgi:glycosyltransferase involved in cell wall biosynthesis